MTDEPVSSLAWHSANQMARHSWFVIVLPKTSSKKATKKIIECSHQMAHSSGKETQQE